MTAGSLATASLLHRGIAQLVEQRIPNPQVVGSIPSWPAPFPPPRVMANMAQDSIAQEDNLPVTSTLGLERWVQFAFIAGALALFWLFDHLIIVIWELFADSDGTLASAGAAI